jgi:peptidoglycan-N-acetylmuramic acid deacetylase
MVSDGHTVGNHTYHHYDMSKISGETEFTKEIRDVEEKYKEITGQEMIKYYRPPQGKYSLENLEMAKNLGYHTFFWSLAYVDWNQDDQPAKEEAFDKLMKRVHPGAIVLLHNTSSTNAEIMDELLTKWEKEGYSFGTLDELI